MTPNRNWSRAVRRALAQAERDGLIEWTGEFRNGKKLYRSTDEGKAWAVRVLGGDDR